MEYMIAILLFLIVSVHWGFATGAILAMKTDWSIPKFLIIILLIWTLIKSTT